MRLDSTGRPHVECPSCNTLHLVRRDKAYLSKPQLRFRCSGCKTTWYANETERNAIISAYEKIADKKAAKSGSKTGKEKLGLKTGEESHSGGQPSSNWVEKIFGVGGK